MMYAVILFLSRRGCSVFSFAHAPFEIHDFLQIAVDDLIEMPFVGVHCGGSHVRCVLVCGLVIFEPMRDFLVVWSVCDGSACER